jgi:Glycosyl transferases group 1
MSDRSLVLVLSNDLSLAAAKTSRHLCLALAQLGLGAIGRDTSLIRWAAAEVEKESPTRREAYEAAVVAKWNKFIFDYGVDTIISLDLHWLFSSQLFVANDRVKRIHSFWFDDLRSHLQSAPMFSLAPHTPLELINGPKVSHHCYGRGQAEELRLLGVERVLPSALAAPAEFLQAAEPCAELKRLAFIGNPGLASPPTQQALAAMERGENLAALRRLARQEILNGLSAGEPTASWIRQSPGVVDLLAAATEQRLSSPHMSAISLLTQVGKGYPEAFDFLNRNGLILDAALLVKFVNRYDRPGLVLRLSRRGWLDVYGTPEQWAPYGIVAQPTVPFPRLASVYRRYPAHLNAANCARDATANEKLFEIAACARLSLNLDSPDVRACYSNEEIILAESDEALEAAAEEVLRDPAAALASGEKARQRTAEEHLWEHRLRKALA